MPNAVKDLLLFLVCPIGVGRSEGAGMIAQAGFPADEP